MTGLQTRRLATALGAAFLVWGGAASRASAATVQRVAHTVTVLTTGDTLLVGGLDETETPTATAYLRTTSIDSSAYAVASMGVARASHTATLMPNGCVFVLGGRNGGGVLNTYDIYNPANNSWLGTTAIPSGVARYNHTSTLLNDGRILLCGGQNGAGTALASCELYTPTSCTAGSFSGAPPSLQQQRYNHTAVLLKDGKVWFAGGATSTVAGYTATTERFDPATNSFNSASPLGEARGYHTATQMGDGRILVVGGYNARDRLANIGILSTAEIYDPVANSVVAAPEMATRRMQHAATLSPDGLVQVFGGLGNVTTSYFTPSFVLRDGSFLTSNFSGTYSTMNHTGGNISIQTGFTLETPFVGVIADGEVQLSSPSIVIPDDGGKIYFRPALNGTPDEGVRLLLDGVRVGCVEETGSIDDNCGRVEAALTMDNLDDGFFYTYPRLRPIAESITSGTLNWTVAGGPPHDLTDSSGDATLLNTSNLTVTAQIAVPRAFLGFNVTNARFTIISGDFSQTSSFTVTLDGGEANLGAPLAVQEDIDGNTFILPTLTFNNLSGDASWAGVYPGQSIASGWNFPEPTDPDINLTVRFEYAVSGVDLDEVGFSVDAATVVIRKAIFTDTQYYNPTANQWTLNSPDGTVNVTGGEARYGHSATLMTNGDTLIIGGRECNGATCANEIAAAVTSFSWLKSFDNFNTGVEVEEGMPQVRALHTATLLPSGQILLAGGTNGPSVLRTATLFDPSTEEFTDTATPMSEVRDLHTATLLPNGRVLLAGGFTTNAASTGSTRTTEIYYPDTRVFLPGEPMISARSNHTATLMPNGHVLVAGGFGTNDVITGNAEIYSPSSGTWTAAATMPGGCERALHAAVQLKSGLIMLIGGINSGGILASSALYNPGTNTWDCASVPAMPLSTPLRSHTATLLFDGRVLVAGGNDGFGESNSSYIYDPASNTWSTTHPTPFLFPRFNHTATLLPNGTVMMIGGTQRFGNVPVPHEFYHVNASSWVTSGQGFRRDPRAYHTMTLALNNRLYGLGGSDGTIGGVGVSLLSSVERGYFTSFPDLNTKNSPPSFRQSTITATSPALPLPGQSLTIVGNQFRGGTEASGGGTAAQDSKFSFPRVVLQQLDPSGGAASQSHGGFVVDLTTQVYANADNYGTLNTSVTVALPATNAGLPFGWYALRVGSNDIYSEGKVVQVGPPKPTGAPSSVAGTALSESTMSWTWSGAGMLGHDGYVIYNATTGVFIATVPLTTTSYIQRGLAPSATVSIIVAGYSLSGDGALTYSPTNYTFSTAPVSLTIASVTFSDLLLYWNTNGNSEPGTRYEVYQSTDNFTTSFSTPVPLLFNLTTNFTTISGLQENTTYTFRVRAFNLAGQASNYSGIASTQTRTSVSDLQGSATSSTTITWTWNPVVPGQYRVYNATSGAFIVAVASPPYIDGSLGVNTSRAIRVSAVTAAGEGPLHPSVTAYTLASTPGMASPAYTAADLTDATLVWTSNGNPLSVRYRVEFYQSGSTEALSITTSTALTRSFTNLTAGTAYDAIVYAVNDAGVDSPPLVVGSTYTMVQVPQSITFINTTPTTIDLSWVTGTLTPPPAILNSTYTIYQVVISSDNFVTSVSTPVPFSSAYTGSTATLTGLLTATTYWVRVSARNPFGRESAFVQDSTITFNGGAAAGSLAGVITANGVSSVAGTLGNGRSVVLRSPGGAFPSDTGVTISSHGVFTMCPNGANLAFHITPNTGLQPTKNLFFTFDYSLADLAGVPVGRAILMRFDPASGTCVPLETVLDPAGNTLTARINHFSLFQVAQAPLFTQVSAARVFPNPYRAAHDGFLTIDRLPPNARVRVFTLRGELVHDQTANAVGMMTWSATNGSGRSLASGIYLIHVESGGSKKIMKLSVIR